MTLTTLDWLILAACLFFPFIVAARAARRAGESLGQYFLAGRELPWWLAGTSMVATTFAADTPLAVAGIIATDGIAGNWIWWSAALGSMLSVLFFARLWRRAGILTDVAFVELRYSQPRCSAGVAPSISDCRSTASSSAGSTWRWPRSSA